jgi:hypothetical protein
MLANLATNPLVHALKKEVKRNPGLFVEIPKNPHACMPLTTAVRTMVIARQWKLCGLRTAAECSMLVSEGNHSHAR